MYGMLPRFVSKECLSSAIAVNSTYTQLAVFAGPVIAGWIILSYGISWAFLVNTLGYLILIIAMLFLKTPEDYIKPGLSDNTVIKDIIDGLTYIKRHKGLIMILILTLAAESLGGSLYHKIPA
ncbi:MAG: DHA3 family macrolide efflux protein-like MFS transporter [Gammaproteobacteria bacterium]|jgi:DHA3 family macrolide efflux protein-like MFS transporter